MLAGGRVVAVTDFNPRPPCGGRHDSHSLPTLPPTFQSTAPVWGPTRRSRPPRKNKTHFNPRPPCGGRRDGYAQEVLDFHFNPRPPCGGRRGRPYVVFHGTAISIHGPRVGADRPGNRHAVQVFISIHGPRVGADERQREGNSRRRRFQSTAPVWGPTGRWRAGGDDYGFQSTAPVWGPTANVDKNAAAFLCICAIFLHF